MNGTKQLCPDERDVPFVPAFLEVLGAAGRVGTGQVINTWSRSRLRCRLHAPTPEMQVRIGIGG